jgi:hypothetical protein
MTELEHLIRDARDYIRVSDDLRPSTLEAARSYEADRASDRSVVSRTLFALAISFAILVTIPSWDVFASVRESSGDAVTSRALRISEQSHVSFSDGLLEAIQQSKRGVARKLGVISEVSK